MNQSGSSLIPVLMATGIIAMAALAVSPLLEQQRKQANQVNTAISLSVARTTLMAVIQNQSSWNGIKNDVSCNSTLKCVRDGSDCATELPDINSEYPINCVYDATGAAVLLNNGVQGGGFDLSGKPCSGSGGAVNAACVIKPRITWKLLCSAAPCVGSPIQVNVAFDVQTEKIGSLNTARFSLSLIR